MPQLDSKLLRYLVTGVANTTVGLSIIFACKLTMDLSDGLANLIGYAFGIILSFFLNRKWTFRFRGAGSPAFLRYLLVLAVAYLCNLATVLAAISFEINTYFAQTMGVVPYTLIGYFGSRYYAFSERPGQFSLARKTPC